MNPTLTIAIPAYNSQDYLARAIDSLIGAGEGMEVIVVNDGSSDNTSSIARAYEEAHPGIVRAIDQENRGWGGVVNHALELASGTYFYILDSDDVLDTQVLKDVLQMLKSFEDNDKLVDVLVTNFVYNHVADGSKHTISYSKLMPSGRVLSWSDLSKPGLDQYLMIHALCYRTALLRESGLKLVEHMSYMDSIVAMHPLPLVETLYYKDCDLYYYTIGREGQSIGIETLQRHIDQQITAVKLVIDDFRYADLNAKSPQLAKCVARYLSAMLTVSAIYLFKINTAESLKQFKDLWNYLKDTDPDMYKVMKRSLAGAARRRTWLGRWSARGAYALCKNVFKFA